MMETTRDGEAPVNNDDAQEALLVTDRYGLALAMQEGNWAEVFKHSPAINPDRFL
jgi:hypothetical protein